MSKFDINIGVHIDKIKNWFKPKSCTHPSEKQVWVRHLTEHEVAEMGLTGNIGIWECTECHVMIYKPEYRGR